MVLVIAPLKELSLLIFGEFADVHGCTNVKLSVFDHFLEVGQKVVKFDTFLDKSLGLADEVGDLLDGLAGLEQLTEGECLFNRVNVLALEVFGDHRVEGFLVGHFPYDAGDCGGELVAFLLVEAIGTVTALSHDDFVPEVFWTDGYGLQQPMLANARRQFLDGALVKSLARVSRTGLDFPCRDVLYFCHCR